MKTLEGKCALITGGASGIGRATVLLFADEGAAVAIADIDDAAGMALTREIQASGGKAIYLHCDVTRAEDCQRAVEKTVEQLGGLDILFNNAGMIRRADVLGKTVTCVLAELVGQRLAVVRHAEALARIGGVKGLWLVARGARGKGPGVPPRTRHTERCRRSRPLPREPCGPLGIGNQPTHHRG